MNFKFYDKLSEDHRILAIAVRDTIMDLSTNVEETTKYGMPCFTFLGKPLLYLWSDKKTNIPYVLFVDGKLIDDPRLQSDARKKMKIYPFDVEGDMEDLAELLLVAVGLRS